MKKTAVIALLAILASSTLKGQTPLFPRDTLMRNNLVQMSPIKVSSGILEDYGDNSIAFRHFNGHSLVDSNYVDFELFSRVYNSIRNSSFSQNGFPTTTVYRDSLSHVFRRGNAPVTTLFYKYHYLKSNALTDSLVVQKSDGHIEDRFNSLGEWVNPYDSSYVFCFAPYMSTSGDEVSFYFRNDFLLTNQTITSIQFDPDDGSGYRQIALQGTTLVNVDYNTSGIENKEIKMKVTLADNTEYVAHSFFTSIENNSFGPGNHPFLSPSNPSLIPVDSLTVVAQQSYMGYQPTAKVYMFYANGRTSIQKPLIYAECFDPLPKVNDLMSNPNSFGNGFKNFSDITEFPDSITTNYDILYIDWQQSTAPIEANADIMIQVINWVNDNKTTTEKNVLMGHSMGGLIARYALCKMEHDDNLHDVKTFISYDSPHFGANVPTGYLYLAQFLYNKIEEVGLVNIIDLIANFIDSSDISIFGVSLSLFCDSFEDKVTLIQHYLQYIMALRDAPSVRQMLWNYVNNRMTRDILLYNQLQNQLYSWQMPSGDSGNGILNLCISNGGVNDYISPQIQQTLFRMENSLSPNCFIMSLLGREILSSIYNPDVIPYILIPGQPGFHSYIHVKTDIYNGNRVFEYKSEYHKNSIFGEHVQTIEDIVCPSWNGANKWDSAYGSYAMNPQSIRNQESFSFTLDDPGLFEIILDIDTPYLRFPFVPIVSALAYKRNVSNLTVEDFRTDFRTAGLDYSQLPFDGYILPDSTLYHGNPPTKGTMIWADRMQDFHWGTFPTSPVDGSTFTVVDDHPEKYDDSNPIVCTWSTSDNTKATVTSSGTYAGTLHIGFGGPVTIYADIQHRGGHLILKHYVDLPLSPFQGFPNYSLSVEDGLPNQNGVVENYIVTATALSSLPDSVTRRMTYRWGIKRNTTDQITWTSLSGIFGPNPSKMYNIPEAANCRMVYFYATYGSYQSPTYSICCWPSSYIILMNPEGYMYVPGDGDPIIQVKGLGGGATVMYDDKQIPFNHTPTVSEICTELVKDDSFVQLLKTLKPWGTEEMLLIPYQLCQEGKEPEQQFICVLYKDFNL